MSTYFTTREFACPCCGESRMDEDFVLKLDRARDGAGTLFHITSGFRCIEHNQKVGGSVSSSHMKGRAVDIATANSVDRFKILSALLRTGFKRIGVGKTFIHVDLDFDKTPDVTWVY